MPIILQQAQAGRIESMKVSKVSEVLQKALDGFGPNGETWCNFNGSGVPPKPDGRCAETAMNHVNATYEIRAKALSLVMQTIGVREFEDSRYRGLNRWNDDPARTFPEVKDAFNRAIALARQEEKS